jgi:hypothetical protein
MRNRQQLKTEAHHCRSQALNFEGKPEALFLLRAADMYEELARVAPQPGHRQAGGREARIHRQEA